MELRNISYEPWLKGECLYCSYEHEDEEAYRIAEEKKKAEEDMLLLLM